MRYPVIPVICGLAEIIKADLPQTLSREESLLELVKMIEAKYPGIIVNRKRYEFAPIYDEIIKALEYVIYIPDL